jgi:hypothetical protein
MTLLLYASHNNSTLPISIYKKLLPTKKQHYYPQKVTAEIATTDITFRSRKKPDWVTDEIIKIKALMPHASCRIISLRPLHEVSFSKLI